MAKNAASSVGGVVGFVLGLLILGGIGGTPFYLSMLRSNQSALQDELRDPIESIRRVVLDLDEHLNALSDLYAVAGDEAAMDSSDIDSLLADAPDIMPSDAMSRLDASASLLAEVERNDQERGIDVAVKGRIERGKPNVRSAAAMMRNKYLKAHASRIAQAEAAIRKIHGTSIGDASSMLDLSSNRIHAIYRQALGRIAMNRAVIEQWQAAELCRSAEAIVPSVLELQRTASSTRSQIPTLLIESVEAELAKNATAMSEAQAQADRLATAVSKHEAAIEKLEEASALGRRRMAELEASGAAIHEPDGEYAQLSNAVRQAEASVEALRNGTLSDATIIPDDQGNMLHDVYEGGDARRGLRDLQFDLERLQEQIKTHESIAKSLQKRKAEYEAMAKRLAGKANEAEDQADALMAKIDQLMEEAHSFLKDGDAASDEAVKELKKTWDSAKLAANEAGKQNREARTARNEAKGPEAERLEMIMLDGDMQASMHCLTGEAGYGIALTYLRQIEALQSMYATESYIASITGGEAPNSIASSVADLRKRAIKQVAQCTQYYDDAAQAIAKTSADGVQGKNYVWQTQVGEAAIHLLHAALLTDEDAIRAQKTAAYDLLTAAAKDREQSPLLDKAIQTILYLQKDAAGK